jgi:hypothetical protein
VRIKLALLAVLGCAAIGASCSHDPDPTLVPTGSPVITTPTVPPPPEMPAAALEDSPSGAESFARYWLLALDYAYQTGDTSLVRKLAQCRGCSDLVDGIDRSYSEGDRIEGGRFTVHMTRLTTHIAGKSATVELTYSSTKRRVISMKGMVTEVAAENNARLLLALNRKGETWLIVNAQPVK